MDFKIGDDFTEKGPIKRNSFSKKSKNIIIVVSSLFVGISVFILLFLIFNTNKSNTEKETINKTILSLNDKNVISSYRMITYGFNKGRNIKFLNGDELNSNSFNNQEKYYYALQFCVFDDLTKTNEKDENGNVIYTLPKEYMDVYMESFFGKNITYDTSTSINNTFKFSVGSYNTGTITYDDDKELFKIVFTSFNDIKESQDDIYYKLDKAYSYDDGRLILEEKVIYSKIENNNNVNYLVLYNDKKYTNKIGEINEIVSESNGTIDDFTVNDIDYYYHVPLSFDFDDYKDKASTIIYNFKLGSYGYYFVNNKVK